MLGSYYWPRFIDKRTEAWRKQLAQNHNKNPEDESKAHWGTRSSNAASTSSQWEELDSDTHEAN